MIPTKNGRLKEPGGITPGAERSSSTEDDEKEEDEFEEEDDSETESESLYERQEGVEEEETKPPQPPPPPPFKTQSLAKSTHGIVIESKPFGFQIKPRKDSDVGAYIHKVVKPEFQKRIPVGCHIKTVNSVDVSQMPYKEILNALRNAGLPATITFVDPSVCFFFFQLFFP